MRLAGARPLAFKQATCRGVEPEKLHALTAADPRFVETAYLLGLVDVGSRKLDEADAQFARAYAWRPRWPALTQSMANVAMTAEEFAQALRLYDETLAADPRAADALLGKVRALTYLGKAVEVIAAVDQLLGERWHLGDARYWRALNENQLEVRRGVVGRRAGRQAPDQRGGAEAGRHHRVSPSRAGRVAHEV